MGLRFSVRGLGCGSAALMAAAVALMLTAGPMPVIFAGTAFFGLGFGAALVSMVSLFSMYFGRDHYPRIMGIAMPFRTILASGEPPFAGALFDVTGSYVIPFTVLIFLLLGGVLCLALASPPLHPSMKGGSSSP